ncbi:MAG TPA: peptidoglycan-binding domain-containing protein [Bryobacteraceae bacterium]|nr:peptidoglycan-binding domain-containing protein [Bryobacteraceae bacterium]
MRHTLACAAMLGFVILAWSAQPAQPVKQQVPAKGKQTPATKTSTPRKSVSTARKSPAKGTRAVAHRSVASARKGGKRAPAKQAASWRSRQVAPTPERYREIQTALAAKGYLKPEEANGTWGQSSIDALKRFQNDQKIESTGKINSLSLIALGLGPRHDSAAAKAGPAPPTDRP